MINCGINSFCGLAKPISSAISFQLNKFINYTLSITEKQTFYIVAPLHSTPSLLRRRLVGFHSRPPTSALRSMKFLSPLSRNKSIVSAFRNR